VRSPHLSKQGTALHPPDESQGLSRSAFCNRERLKTRDIANFSIGLRAELQQVVRQDCLTGDGWLVSKPPTAHHQIWIPTLMLISTVWDPALPLVMVVLWLLSVLAVLWLPSVLVAL
jgi:hypothetical protein